MEMSVKYREDLVGKRFLTVAAPISKNGSPSKASDLPWKAGVIRAATHKDNKDKELQVLVEYDGEGWRRRQWINVYGNRFHAFFVEELLVLANRTKDDAQIKWPALTFESLKSCTLGQRKPVEFLVDRQLVFLEESQIEPYMDCDSNTEAGAAARRWVRRQQAQRVLKRAPAALRGCRAQVYRARGATQWYTAVIIGCNSDTGELTLTDDTVLEEHNENPILVQIRLLGDGVIDAILRGESVGMLPRRSRSGALLARGVNQVTRVSGRNSGKNNKNHRNNKTNTNTSTTNSSTTTTTTTTNQQNSTESPDIEKESKKSGKKRKDDEAIESPIKLEVKEVEESSEHTTVATESENKSSVVANKPVSVKSETVVEQEVAKEVIEETPSVQETCEESPVLNKEEQRLPEVPKDSEESKCKVEEVSKSVTAVATSSEAAEEGGGSVPPPAGDEVRRTIGVEEAVAAGVAGVAVGRRDDVVRMEEGSRLFPDDRSDSGVSSLRSTSGDERSGSRSSALSAGDDHEPPRQTAPERAPPLLMAHPHPHPHPLPHAHPHSLPLAHQLPLQHQLSSQHQHHQQPVSVAHQHQSHQAHQGHPSVVGPQGHQPPSSAPQSHAHYPPSPLMHLPPPGLYGSHELWSKRYADEYVDRERHERLLRERREQEIREIENQQMKDREKAREREKLERDLQEKERQEKAVHKHFEESLRLANQKRDRLSWNLIHSLPPPPRSVAVSEHERILVNDRIRNDVRERSYYVPPSVQRPPSVPNKAEYPPPPAHSRITIPQKPIEKPIHVSLPKAEPNFNMYNYSGYHHSTSYMNHDSKHKSEHINPAQIHNNLTVTKTVLDRERDSALPTPPPLMNELKNSVIVKHDAKIPHHALDPKIHSGHSPKLRGSDVPPQTHYLSVSQPTSGFRSAPPPQSIVQRGRPHNSPAPVTNRTAIQPQHPQPHPQQTLDRYARPPSGYTYHSPVPTSVPPPVPSKPKVSSPAPPHIYGKPNAGITSGIPVCRAQEPQIPVNPIPLTSKANTLTTAYGTPHPPPAHWRGDPKILLPPGASPPAAHPAPLPLTYQTQPLDLGISADRDDGNRSPKRRGTPVQNISEVAIDSKKRKVEPSGQAFRQDPVQQYPPVNNSSPLLSRVVEPSPLIASAATTITTLVNSAAYCTSPAPRTVTDSPVRIPSADGAVRPPSVPEVVEKTGETEVINVQSSLCPSPLPTVNTPVKVASPAPSSSPKDNNAPVRHLKKAWLQRHETAPEGEQDSIGNGGGGSSVTLPLVTRNPETLSLNNVGSMAVNSIIRNKPLKVSRKSNQKEMNGHCDDSRSKLEDSSSSDQERSVKSPPKRKPPKVKRKKGGGSRKSGIDEMKKKKISTLSDSASDSDKESNSDKDSDSGASLNHSSVVKRTANGGNGNSTKESKEKEPRKRGRRPKNSKSDKTGDDEPIKNKRPKDEPPGTPFNKPPINQLKKTGESFLQDGACCDVAPKLAKCRECRWTPNQRSKNMSNIFCRFYAFRRLRYTKNGQLAIAGFSDPNKDPSEDDKKLWLQSCGIKDLDIEMSCFLLRQIGEQFCELLQQECDAKNHNLNEDKTIAWKRVVQGVREMCDVCETTLFNFHWACGKCGFVVCLDCYKSRAQGDRKVWNTGNGAARERDEYGWLTCTSRIPHEQTRLMPTQIVAGDSLTKIGLSVHHISALWGVPRFCECPPLTPPSPSAIKACRNMLLKKIKGNDKEEVVSNGVTENSGKLKNNALTWLSDIPIKTTNNDDSSSSDSESGENYSTLRELLIRPSNKPGSGENSPTNGTGKIKKSRLDMLDDVISSINENKDEDKEADMDVKPFELKHFVRRYHRNTASGKEQLPIRIMTLLESKVLYPDTPHSWLCDGKLLRLLDPVHPGNYKIFQDQWKRGQPVIVSDVLKNMNKDLWTPESFSRDFGDEKNDLINCITGNIVPNQPMKKFWDGFEYTSKRLKDEHGEPMLLKLKDWPPGEDFAELLPARFADLMKNLPLQEYTLRTGRLNLASRLPECFVRPDLGPKMYNAYGSALHPGHGTTNLHLDVSDAVNVMVYVSGPKDVGDKITKEAYRAIDEAGCDILTRRRVRERGELPGALWHIYNPRDADKIRDLLNKTAIERGAHPQPHHDPIHDQSCYLDAALRERLYKEYRVEGYAVAQCLGDAVFIPAGAPHQVRNLHDCIKVAEDFVSPENVSHCFHLTQEFRDLSDTHTNHEDKLQIKNIIYHAVKDSLDCLQRAASSSEVNANSDPPKDEIKKEMLP